MTTYLTDRKLLDRRFKHTEDLIFQIYFNSSPLTVQSLSRKAGFSRSTFYRHHRAIHSITSDYEKYLLHKFSYNLRKFPTSKPTSKTPKITKTTQPQIIKPRPFFRSILIFILTNKRTITTLLAHHSPILRQFIDKSRPQISTFRRFPPNSDHIFQIYASEISEILTRWIFSNSPEITMINTLNSLIYLTNSANIRLAPVNPI